MNDYIELRKERPFGDKISATFDFIKLNFKSLFTAILYIAGPFMLLSAAGSVLYMNDLSNMMVNVQTGVDTFSSDYFIGIFIYLALFFLGYSLLLATVLEYMNIYSERKSTEISVGEVWQRVKRSFLHLLMSYFFLFIMILLVVGLLALIIGGLSLGSAALSVIFVFGLMFLYFYFIVSFSLFPNILINEKRGIGQFFDIVIRCFRLIKGKWWSTFGVLFVSGIIVYVMSLLLSLPLGVTQITDVFTAIQEGGHQNAINDLYDYSVVELVFTGIASLGQQLFSSIMIIAISFQYFNLVERKEAKGLFEQIGDIKEEKHDELPATRKPDEEEDEEHY